MSSLATSGSTAASAAIASIAEAIAPIETYLTTGPFGDGAAIAGTAAAYYRGAARACARACGLDPQLLAAEEIAHVEALRRAATDEALRLCMSERVEEARAVFQHYLDVRERALTDVDVQRDADRHREAGTVPEPEFPATGAGHWLYDLLIELFDETTTIAGRRVGVAPAPVTAGLEAARQRAVALARRSVPRLAGDVLRGVRRICLYRADQPYSGYTNAAPLFVFVAGQMFDEDHIAAELLLHECLHQKLNDLSVIRALFREDYHDAHSATVSVPWSFGSQRVRHFSADRTFAAFHVYSHQALFYLGMLATATTAQDSALAGDNAMLAWARAAHFAAELAGEGIRAELGADGHRFVAWLSRAVDDLGAVRLPDGSLLSSHAGVHSTPTATGDD